MKQGSLFDALSAPDATVGLAGIMPAIRAAMNRVAGEYPEGRKLLVDAITGVAQREGVALTSGGGKSITLDQLNKWLQSGERGHEPSLAAILCFCIATNNFSPLLPVLRLFGLCVVPQERMKYLEYGESLWRLREEKQRLKNLEARL